MWVGMFWHGRVLTRPYFSLYFPDIYDSPVYMWPHSKVVLVQAILADTLFLANNHIMDYSLLVGLDREKGEVVVGIIGGEANMAVGSATVVLWE